MAKQIFVNLPVRDLDKTRKFFNSLGFSFNEQFSDENALSMVVSDDIYIMLLLEKFFQTFTHKPVGNDNNSTSLTIALSAASRAEVDDIMTKAIAAGATDLNKTQDHGWMYGRSFYDLDGHLWEFVYMDASAMQPPQ